MNFDDILDTPKVVKTAPKKKNYVVIDLDRSGSMSSIKKEAIEFFNSQVIEAQNAKELENRICLITFADEARIEQWDVDASEVELLDEKSYIPDGWTAMLDSVGMGISKLLQQPDINEDHVSVLFIIISDGIENHSGEYKDPAIVAKMIKEVNEVSEEDKAKGKTPRWTFVYLGANQDLSKVKEYGMEKGNTMAFAASSVGMLNATASSRVATKNFYGGRVLGMTNTSSFYGGVGDDDATGRKKNKKTKTTA